MARERSPNRDKAKELWFKFAGKKTIKDIAAELGVSESLIRKWKSIDKWDEPNGNVTKGNSKAKSKKPKGNAKKDKELKLADIKEDELNERERLFCLCYIKNYNASMAIIKAGYNPGNSQRAAEMGYQLLQRSPVKAEVNRLKEMKRQSIMLDPDDIVERYMQIAFSDITDFVTFGTAERVIGIDDDGELINRLESFMDFKDHTMVDGGLISEIKKNKMGMSIKLEDRQKALSWLADYFNMNPMNQHKQIYDKHKLRLQEAELELRKEIEKNKAW